MTETKELRDLLARALGDLPFDADGSRNSDAAVAATLSIVQPMLDAAYARGREEGLEEAAKVAESRSFEERTNLPAEIATAIRANTEK